MATDKAAVRRELEEVEELIAGVRRDTAGIREEVGGGQGPGDASDVGSLLAATEEQEALLSSLEQRRDDLRQRLGDTDDA